MTRLYFDGREVAEAINPRCSFVSGTYQKGRIHIEWRRWFIDELRLSHWASLLFLQGASMQQLVEPYVLLRASPRRAHDPVSGLLEVALAEILVAPEELSRVELLALLLPEAREA